MAISILRLPQVKFATGLSRSSIYAYIQNGKFPCPVQLGARSVGWLSSDIDSWIESRVVVHKSGRHSMSEAADA